MPKNKKLTAKVQAGEDMARHDYCVYNLLVHSFLCVVSKLYWELLESRDCFLLSLYPQCLVQLGIW